MNKKCTMCAGFLLLLPLTAIAAQIAVPLQAASAKLIDPKIATLADGVERRNLSLHTEEAYLPILYPSSHAANLLQLKNGDVLCVWFSGTWEGSSGWVSSCRAGPTARETGGQPG